MIELIESILQQLQLNSTGVVLSNYYESWHGVDAGGPTLIVFYQRSFRSCPQYRPIASLGMVLSHLPAVYRCQSLRRKQTFATRFALWLPTRQIIAKQTTQPILLLVPTLPHLQPSNAPQTIAWTVIPTSLPLISSRMSTQMLTGSAFLATIVGQGRHIWCK